MTLKAAKAILKIFWGDPIVSARNSVQHTVQRHARQVAEIEYEKAMIDFYYAEAENLDPHNHWWEFAQAKQCWADHMTNYEGEVNRLVSLTSRKNAAQAKLAALVQKKG